MVRNDCVFYFPSHCSKYDPMSFYTLHSLLLLSVLYVHTRKNLLHPHKVLFKRLNT
jgi:hypothetical protein